MKKLIKRTFVVIVWLALFITAIYLPYFITSSPYDKSITILTWGDILHPDVVKNFEQKTGIKVHMNYYSSNEELIVKMKATKGIGYDLIVPSDYAVKLLLQYNLLKPINHARLNFMKELNTNLLDQYYDPNNQYSIPFEWEFYGLGINSDYFAGKPCPASWSMLFNVDKMSYPIVMTNDPIEAIQFASFYLYGNKKSLNEAELENVKKVLISQRPFIEAYASFRADYFLATQTSPLVLTSSSYILRTKKLYPFVDILLPKEGSFITIENFAIPKASNKEAMVYAFLNEVYSQESAKLHFRDFAFFPATLKNIEDPVLSELLKPYFNLTKSEFKKFKFIEELVPQDKIQNLWVEVKTSSIKFKE